MTKEQKRYEWNNKMELKDDAGVYFKITQDVILNKDLGKKRIATMSYLLLRKGLDNKLDLSLNSLVKWCGKKPNKSETGINKKFVEATSNLREENYIDYFENLKNEGSVEIVFNNDKYQEQLNEKETRFATIYLDEFKKIMDYTNLKNKEISISDDVLLLVFAYLKMKIYKRKNELGVSEINKDNKNSHEYDIRKRQEACPEVYSSYCSDIANELGITLETFMLALNVLKKLNLIYTEALPRFKKTNEKGEDKWVTSHTLFYSPYHRERDFLLANGKVYYENEVNNKKKLLKSHWNNKE